MKRNYPLIVRNVCFSAAVIFTAAACSDDNETPKTDNSLFRGNDISALAEITAEAATKTPTIEISRNGDWKLYAMTTTQDPDFDHPVMTGTTAGSFPLDGMSYTQYCLEYETNRTVLSYRQLPIESQPNFRDLGGYKTTDGKFVRWGLIFRSGKLDELTDADLSFLASIPLRTVVDFRSESEREEAPDRVPSTVTSEYNFSMDAGNLNFTPEEWMEIFAKMTVDEVKQMMIVANETFVTDSKDMFKSFFEVASQPGKLPLMFHCTAGKDRAGFASAMLLGALGVDRETVLADYMLTNTYTGASIDKYGEILYYLQSVQPEYIGWAFEIIDNEFGGVENYLKTELEVDIEKLREMYLY